jgi:hypothetical protein
VVAVSVEQELFAAAFGSREIVVVWKGGEHGDLQT